MFIICYKFYFISKCSYIIFVKYLKIIFKRVLDRKDKYFIECDKLCQFQEIKLKKIILNNFTYKLYNYKILMNS